MTNHYDLTNKKILLTGANGQLGQGLASALLECGAFVYITDLPPDMDLKFASCLQAKKLTAYRYLPLDITSSSALKKAAADFGAELDVLINNAGSAVFTPFEKRAEQELEQVMQVNLKGTIMCTQVFSAAMIKRKKGKIVNIGSVYGVVPADKKIYGDSGRNSSEIYGATKAGVIQLTRYWAAYLGEYNITVNAVSPGGIFNNQKQSFVDHYTAKTPLQRMATVSDLQGIICFLCSDDASYITGQNIVVDGGFALNQ